MWLESACRYLRRIAYDYFFIFYFRRILPSCGCRGESTGESAAARETDSLRSPACEVIDCCLASRDGQLLRWR